MLILTRRVSESVVISGKEREDLARILDSGATVKMTVLGVKGNQIRIGFEAPPEVAVHREEIHDRIQRGDEHLKKEATA